MCVCVCVCVCARARVHTQGADSLRLGDFGRGWRYLVEVGVSEKELNRSGHISLLTSHFFPLSPPSGPGLFLSAGHHFAPEGLK